MIVWFLPLVRTSSEEARGCLLTDVDTVEDLVGRVEQAINAFTDAVDSSDAQTPTTKERHFLCHYFLCDPRGLIKFYIHFASPYIAHEKLDEVQQRALEKLLLGDAVPTSSAGFVLERRVHEMLQDVTRMEARLLGDVPGPDLSVAIEKREDLDVVELTGSLFFLPTSSNTVVISSFHAMLPDVLLFQVTIPMKHPVDGNGIVRVLKGLGLWHRSTTPSAALVFIVPEEHASKFTQQRIEMVDAVTGASDVQLFNGIGKQIAKVLKDEKIETVNQLEASPSTTIPVLTAKAALKRHRNSFTEAGDTARSIFKAIPQYVWVT